RSCHQPPRFRAGARHADQRGGRRRAPQGCVTGGHRPGDDARCELSQRPAGLVRRDRCRAGAPLDDAAARPVRRGSVSTEPAASTDGAREATVLRVSAKIAGQALAERVVADMMAKDAFSTWLGISVDRVAPDASTTRMTVRPEMVNGFGV